MKVVIASTIGFLALLPVNLGAAIYLDRSSQGPAIPPRFRPEANCEAGGRTLKQEG